MASQRYKRFSYNIFWLSHLSTDFIVHNYVRNFIASDHNSIKLIPLVILWFCISRSREYYSARASHLDSKRFSLTPFSVNPLNSLRLHFRNHVQPLTILYHTVSTTYACIYVYIYISNIVNIRMMSSSWIDCFYASMVL